MISNLKKHQERSKLSLRGYFQASAVSGSVEAMIGKLAGQQKKSTRRAKK